jgi:hypothetical protein
MLHCPSRCRGQVDMALEDVVKVDKGSKGRGGGRGGGGGVMRGRGGAGSRGARAPAPYQVRASPLPWPSLHVPTRSARVHLS